jgi:hypothetical protein
MGSISDNIQKEFGERPKQNKKISINKEIKCIFSA